MGLGFTCCCPPVVQACSNGMPSTIYLRTNGGTKYTLTESSPFGSPIWQCPNFDIPAGSLVYPAQNNASCASIATVPAYITVECNYPTLSVTLSIPGSNSACGHCAYHQAFFSTLTFGSTVTSLTNSPLSIAGTWLSTAFGGSCALPGNPFAGQGWTILPT